jgi:Nif11 domain
MATTTQLEQFAAEVMKDADLQKQLLNAATDLEAFAELAVNLANGKGLSFTKEEVLAATGLAGFYYVEELKSNSANPRFSGNSSGNTSSGCSKT